MGINRPNANSSAAAAVTHGPVGATKRSSGMIRMVSTPPAIWLMRIQKVVTRAASTPAAFAASHDL